MTRCGRRRRLAWILAACGLTSLVAARSGVVALAERPSPVAAKPEAKVIFPPHQAVLLVGTFNVIAQGGQGDLVVDGRPQPWEPFESPVRVAKVRLNPGLHEIRVGAQKIELSVGLSEEDHEGPKSWPVYRLHTIQADKRCAACHETQSGAGRTSVGPLRSSRACFGCHEKGDFEAVHSHPLGPLERCQDCHALHGSTRKPLLKAPVKKLCDECHAP